MTKTIDVPLSQELAKRINSKAKKCFDNAYQAALLTQGAVYVQGFLACGVKPCKVIEYSWIEVDTQIIDPTFPHLNQEPQTLYYFAAQRLSVKQLTKAIEEAQEDYPEDPPLPIYGTSPYEYYGDLMLGGIEYKVAYAEAEAKCQELIKAK